MVEGRDQPPEIARTEAAPERPFVLAITLLVLASHFLAASIELLIWVR